MKRLSAAFAFTALAALTVAVAQQQTSPQSQALRPASTTQSRTTSDRAVYRQALLKHCFTQLPAANPGMSENDIRDFCSKEINTRYSPRDSLR